MDLGVPVAELAWLVAALVVSGLVMGFLVGLLGIGGGAILVPILYEVFAVVGVDASVRLHLGIGTALAAMVPTTLQSFRSHYSRGAVDMDIVRSMVAFVVAGVVLGSIVARVANAEALSLIWGVCAAALSLRLYLAREHWRLGDVVPGQPFRAVYGLVVGAFSSLMSIGGAVFITGLMTLYGRPIHQAVATSSAFGPMIAIPGALGFAWAGWGLAGLPPGSLGYVNLVGAAAIVPASVFTARLGARAAHGASRRTLELSVATLLALVSLRFLLKAL